MTKKNQQAPTRTRQRNRDPFFAADVDYIVCKDVAELRRFTSDRGKIRSRVATGLTMRQQRMVATAIKSAREMALRPYAGEHLVKGSGR